MQEYPLAFSLFIIYNNVMPEPGNPKEIAADYPAVTLPPHKEGGPIATHLHDSAYSLKEAAIGVNGTVERWGKSAWDHIKNLWNISKEHMAHWFPVGAGFHWTLPWMTAAGGAGAVALLGGAELWRRHRKKKKAQAQEGH